MPERIPKSWADSDLIDTTMPATKPKASPVVEQPPESFAKAKEEPAEIPPADSGVRRKKIYELPIKKSVKAVPPEQPEEMTAGLGEFKVTEFAGKYEVKKFGTHPVRGDRNLPPFTESVLYPQEEKQVVPPKEEGDAEETRRVA